MGLDQIRSLLIPIRHNDSVAVMNCSMDKCYTTISYVYRLAYQNRASVPVLLKNHL